MTLDSLVEDFMKKNMVVFGITLEPIGGSDSPDPVQFYTLGIVSTS